MSLIDRGDYSIYGVKKVEFVSSFIKDACDTIC